MILKRLQASFGKLDGAVLTLQPGLNLLYAPNEGGKSTWCAFLLAMLYGIDASQRDSKAALADKHKYQPWSGKPMAGAHRPCVAGPGSNHRTQQHTESAVLGLPRL